jgi:hypothetical protein
VLTTRFKEREDIIEAGKCEKDIVRGLWGRGRADSDTGNDSKRAFSTDEELLEVISYVIMKSSTLHIQITYQCCPFVKLKGCRVSCRPEVRPRGLTRFHAMSRSEEVANRQHW